MSCDIHGAGMNMENSQKISNKQGSLNINNVILQNSQDCPLCFHPNVFNEWSSYRDAFVSLTTRNFNCPICHSSVQGVDKFTLHLVSHDLRAKVWGPSSSTSLIGNPSAKNGEIPSSSNTGDIQQCKSILHPCNDITEGNSLFPSNNLQCNIAGTNVINEELGNIESTTGHCTKYDQLSNTTYQDFIKEENDLNLNSSPNTNITDKTLDEHTGSSRYLDELLNDYSEFVQQQEHNKDHNPSYGVRKTANSRTSSSNCISSTNFESTKPFQVGGNLFATPSQCHQNTSHASSSNIFNPSNMMNLTSTLLSNYQTNANNLISTNHAGFPDQKINVSNNINDGNINNFTPETANKSEKQVTINVQVPKPLYHKYFSTQLRGSGDQILKDTSAHEKEDNEKVQNLNIGQQNSNSHEYSSHENSITQVKSRFSSSSKASLNSIGNDITVKENVFEDVVTKQRGNNNYKTLPHTVAINEPTPNINLFSSYELNPATGSESLVSSENYRSQKLDLSPTSQVSVQCSLCGWNFDNEKFLQLHTVLMHSPHRKRGNIGGKVIKGGKPKNFGKRQALESFQCRECNGETFKHHEEYTKHLKLVHNDNRYVCHICGKMFKLRGSLLVHVRVVHNPMIDENEEDFHCRTCNRKFSSRHRRDLHEKKHIESNLKTLEEDKSKQSRCVDDSSKPSLMSVNNLSSSPPSIACNEKIQKKDPLKVSMAHYKFDQGDVNSTNLLSETPCMVNNSIVSESEIEKADTSVIKSHTNALLHNQPTHSMEYLSLQNKKSPKHIDTNPNGDATFQCNLCDKKFKRQTHLQQHLVTHEPRQWDCDVCKKTFTTKYFLKKHKRLHTGERCIPNEENFTKNTSIFKFMLIILYV